MQKTLSLSLFILCSICLNVTAQDLLSGTAIMQIPDRKKAVFHQQGVFHSKANPMQQALKDVRNSYVPSRGFERIVFDFSTSKPPRIYAKIGGDENKVYLDFFNTSIGTKISELKNIKYLKNIDFFTLDEDNISVELKFKDTVTYEFFYLENPGRLVIDVQK